jgi:hypothetical protein
MNSTSALGPLDPLLRACDEVPVDVTGTVERLAAEQNDAAWPVRPEDGVRSLCEHEHPSWLEDLLAAAKRAFDDVCGALRVLRG